MFIRGTIEYTGELVGLLLPSTTFNDRRAPVTAVEVSCDGRRAQVTAHLGPVDFEATAVLAADEEVRQAARVGSGAAARRAAWRGTGGDSLEGLGA